MLKKIPLVVCIALVVLSGFGASANQGQTLTVSKIEISKDKLLLFFENSNINYLWSGPFIPTKGQKFCLKNNKLTVGACK
jgi:hypothetical protein